MTPDSNAVRGAGHPPGLYVLFFTELWERYSFYALMALLTLYMDEALHYPQTTSAQIYGGFIGAVYFLPLLGGFVADRWLGFFRTVLIGAVIMGLGQLSLALGNETTFLAALGLVVLGTGMLKPNVSTIVGALYADRPHLRDSGFNIFYMGINIGAFIAPIVVAWLRATYGWGAAFGSAAVAMIGAVMVFAGFRRFIPAAAPRDTPGAAGDGPASPDSRARIVSLLVVFAIVIAFWVAFYQNGFTLTLWARDNTDTTVSPEVFQSVNPLGVILFSPLLVAVWAALRRRGSEPTTLNKIVIGISLTAVSFGIMAAAALVGGDAGKVSPAWLVSSYLVIAMAEICLSPMGLSLVAKVAPARQRGTMMGAWFVATSIGGYLSGFVGRYWNSMPHSRFFLLVVALCLVAAVLMALARRRLGRVFSSAGA